MTRWLTYASILAVTVSATWFVIARQDDDAQTDFVAGEQALGQIGWYIAKDDDWLVALPPTWILASGGCDADLLVAYEPTITTDPSCPEPSDGVVINPDRDAEVRSQDDGGVLEDSGFYPGVRLWRERRTPTANPTPGPPMPVDVPTAVTSSAMTRTALFADTEWRSDPPPSATQFDAPTERLPGDVPLPVSLPPGFQYLPPVGPDAGPGEPDQIRAGVFSRVGWTRAVSYCVAHDAAFSQCPQPPEEQVQVILTAGSTEWACAAGICATRAPVNGWSVSVRSEAGLYTEEEIQALLNLG